MSDEFLIVSLKHTAKSDDYITLWRPNDAGYTLYLPAAGRYSHTEIEERRSYYNNGRTTVAIPFADIEPHFVNAADGYDCTGPVLPNNEECWAGVWAASRR